jgi:hypothetical protein
MFHALPLRSRVGARRSRVSSELLLRSGDGKLVLSGLLTLLGPGCFVYGPGDYELVLERPSVTGALRTVGVYVQLKQ